MAGLLDLISGPDPREMGLLGYNLTPQQQAEARKRDLFNSGLDFAGGLLNAGGISRTPISNGQALGAALSGTAQGAANRADSNLKMQMVAPQIAKANLDLRAEQDWQNMLGGQSSMAGTPQPNGEIVAPAGATQFPGGAPGMPGVPAGLASVMRALGREKGGALYAQYFMRDDDPSKFLKFESGNIYNVKMLDENGAPKLVGRYDAQVPWQYQSGTNGEVNVRPGVLPAMGQVNYTESFNKAMGDALWKVIPITPGGGAFQPFGNMMPPGVIPPPTTGRPQKMGALEGQTGNSTLMGGPGGDQLQAPAGGMGKMLIAPNKNPPGVGESEYAKGMGGAFAKEHSTMIESGNASADQLGYLQQLNGLREMVNQAGGDVNAAAPLKARALALADAMGLDLGKDRDTLGALQAIDAVSKRLVVKNIGSGGMPANNFSEADRQFITQMEQGLSDSGLGWQLKSMLSEKVLRRKMEVGDKITELYQGGAGPADIQKAVSAIKSRPLFAAEDIRAMKLQAADAIKADLSSGAITREQAASRLKKMGFSN